MNPATIEEQNQENKSNNFAKMKPHLVIALFMSLCICSCNSFEHKAKKRLKLTIDEMAFNPETYKMTNMKTVYCDDSLCIIQFVGHGQNRVGGWANSHREYILFKISDEDCTRYRELMIDLDDHNSCFERSESALERLKLLDDEAQWGNFELDYELIDTGYALSIIATQGSLRERNISFKDKKAIRATFLYREARTSAIFRGRDVEL